jgi:peroxiredoxin
MYRYIGGVGIALGALLWCAGAVAADSDLQTAPDFTLGRCVDADSITLSDFLDSPVLLFFFDAGDVECFHAYPYIRNWWRKYRTEGVEVIGIHSPGFEALMPRVNALSAIARSELNFPIALDLERKVYTRYALDRLPVLILLRPGGEVFMQASDVSEYQDVEKGIQSILREAKPDTRLPFIFEPKEPETPKDHPPPTPKLILGYSSGVIANCDSADFGELKRYTDPRETEKGKVYLEGIWKVDEKGVTHPDGEEAYIRVVYSAKDVTVLTNFEPGMPAKVYVMQDRGYPERELWGSALRSDQTRRPYIYMRHPVPEHIVSNRQYGTHELKLIATEGDITFHYLFFE